MRIRIPGTELWRTVEDKEIGNNGRWENEQWGPLNNGRLEPCTVVFETEQELQVVFSYSTWLRWYLEKEGFFKKYTHCQQLRTHNEISSDYISTLKCHFPSLHELDLEIGPSANVYWLLSPPNNRFSSLRFHSSSYSRVFTVTEPALERHLQTLVNLDLDYRHFTMKELLHILQNTPHLQSIRIPSASGVR